MENENNCTVAAVKYTPRLQYWEDLRFLQIFTLPSPLLPPQVHGTGTRQLPVRYKVLLTGTMTNAYLSKNDQANIA